ncbi:AAA family ATPase [Rhizobium sp. LjRoot98]|uniref:AAA family ATPase n=1 Tax=Rhizobium sp. LjRoot98 TaxID=3342345 RepID=UPI003ED1376A
MSKTYKTRSQRLLTSVKDYAMYCAMCRAIRPARLFKSGGPGIIVLVVPEKTSVPDYVLAMTNLIFEDDDRGRTDDVGFSCVAPNDSVEKVEERFETECREKRRAIVLTWSSEALPATVILAADHIFEIDPIGERDLQAACAVVLNMSLTREQAGQLLKFPINSIVSALRIGRSFDNTMRRLRSVPADPKPEEPEHVQPKVVKVTRLEDMHGYGAAKDWGLQLARDLQDWKDGKIAWSDVDTGLLLSGPPGTGKTIFAKALAETCGSHLVAASLGQWQASGHLGDLLRRMRKDFDTAKEKAPSILFIDELDSVGDRDRFSHDNANYSTQVVNGLLECIDGASGREGVVVIGATNNPNRIDPAVRRAGRLDKHIVISMPGPDDRIAILCQHLGESIAEDEKAELGQLTEGMSGADLAQLARDGRRVARMEKRQVKVADLKGHLPVLLQVTGFYRQSVAVHEAGHAVVGEYLQYGKLADIAVASQLNPRIREQNVGGALFHHNVVAFRDRQSHLNEICTFLAGIAAEQIVLGSHGDGAGAGPGNDLERATSTATAMLAHYAMGDQLRYFEELSSRRPAAISITDPWLAENINKVLQQELARATDILRSRRHFLDRLAHELFETGRVSPERFDQLQGERPGSTSGLVLHQGNNSK